MSAVSTLCCGWAPPSPARSNRSGVTATAISALRRDRSSNSTGAPPANGFRALPYRLVEIARQSEPLCGLQALHAGQDRAVEIDAGELRLRQIRTGEIGLG